jgi:arginine exporter protein ArgO
MEKRIQTVIDGVPVIFELLSVGPASPEAITALEENLKREVSANSNLSIQTQNGKTLVAKIGNEQNPATQEDIAKVQKAINTGAINPADLIDRINQIEQAMSQSTTDKPWWTSRTIISNVLFIVVAIAAVFGFNIQVSEEWITIIGVLMGIINIWLRKGTNKPIAKQFLPK